MYVATKYRHNINSIQLTYIITAFGFRINILVFFYALKLINFDLHFYLFDNCISLQQLTEQANSIDLVSLNTFI